MKSSLVLGVVALLVMAAGFVETDQAASLLMLAFSVPLAVMLGVVVLRQEKLNREEAHARADER
jgi:hypothetical protein